MGSLRITLATASETFTHDTFKDSVIIGRSADCAFSIPRENLSREHCLIEKNFNDFFITDLNSKNGVTIDGRRLVPEQRQQILENSTIMLSDQYILKINPKDMEVLPGGELLTDFEGDLEIEAIAEREELPPLPPRPRRTPAPRIQENTKSKADKEAENELFKMILGFVVILGLVMLYLYKS